MARHLKVFAALVALVLTAVPAGASMTYRDTASDANAVNTQGERGFGHGGDVATGPASVASADITSVRFASRFRNGRLSGFAVTVAVADKVVDGTMFSVFAVPGRACDGLVVKHVRTVEGDNVTDLSGSCVGNRTTGTLPPAVVRGNRVTINVPLRALPPQIRKGTVLREIFAYTVAVGPNVKPYLHAPKLDIAATAKSYRIGR